VQGLFAGLDVSTQSCKIVVIDFHSLSVIYVDSVNYDKALPQYSTFNGVVQDMEEGVSESDPLMWIDSIELIFSRLKASNIPQDKILSISVSGQQHGLVALDKFGNLSRPMSKLWNDFSTDEECILLTKIIGGKSKMIKEVGNSQRTGYTAPKIFHMFRHEKENYNRTDTFFLVHNYINWVLTGGKKGGKKLMEPGDTSGTALWNPKRGIWSKKVIGAIDPGLFYKLPDIKPSFKSIGFIASYFVDRYGFSPTCKIDAGSGDNMYGAVGTGNVIPGIVTISLGTSGTAYTFMKKPYIDPEGEIASFCDSTGHYLSLLCVSNLSNGYDSVLKMYDLNHTSYNVIIHQTKPGNNGKILIPWFSGERTPDLPKAASLFFGFQLEDFNMQSLCRAVLEGHVMNLYEGFKRMSVDVKEIRITGGLSKSEAWCQAIADVFETDTVPVEGEGAALGASIHAAWVWFLESGQVISMEELSKPFIIINEKRRKKPIPKNVTVYRKQKCLYSTLTSRIRGFNSKDPFYLRDELNSLLSKKESLE
jgi:xylulokinase